MWGAPVGAMLSWNLVLCTGAESAVVWLGSGVRICGVCLSRSLVLVCPVVWRCISTSVLFCSIFPLSSLG